MGGRRLGIAFVLGIALMSTSVVADNVSGSNELLCSAAHATRCFANGECKTGPVWEWDIPMFIEIDLDGKKLSTTAASGVNRATPIKTLERVGGMIYLQGVEGGRAFSFVISEDTGFLSVGMATEGMALAAFGGCTPRTEGAR
jgi:hypothetical protein